MDMFPSDSTPAGVVMTTNLVETMTPTPTTTTTTTTAAIPRDSAQMMATTTMTTSATTNSRMMSFNLLHHTSSPAVSSSSRLPPLSFGTTSPSPIHNPLTKSATCTVGGGGAGGDRAISSHHHRHHRLRSSADQTLISSFPPPHRGDHHLGESSAQRSHLDLWASDIDIGEKGGKQASDCHNDPSGGGSSSNNTNANSNSNGNLSAGVMRMKKVKARRKVREPRFCFKTMSEVDVLDDGYKWRKYGQKVVKNTQHPRSYYRCTQENCRVKKRIERLAEDPRMVITTYEGRHVHSPSHDDDESQPSSKVTLFW